MGYHDHKMKNSKVVSIRFDEDQYNRVMDIAHLESFQSGKRIYAHDLIRDAVRYVYEDNERMRESFRRTRQAPLSRLRLFDHRKKSCGKRTKKVVCKSEGEVLASPTHG